MISRRRFDLVLFGGLYPLVVVGSAWVVGATPGETGQLLVLLAAVGAVGLLVVFGLTGGPWAIRESWTENPRDEPAPSAVRQAVFLGVTMVVSAMLAVIL